MRVRVLVLGGYGFIGLEIVRRLRAEGHDVIGLGRDAALGKRLAPEIEWIEADLARSVTPADWAPFLPVVDAIVNASGALQDGARDNLQAAQFHAIEALIKACTQVGVRRFVQISAPGAEAGATTPFLRTKAAADAALRASGLDWIIFKPGLVIGANAYGGTALLRMLAAFPIVQPILLADRRMQTVAMADVTEAVALALGLGSSINGEFDLVEPAPHNLAHILKRLRARLGFAPARAMIAVPRSFGYALARLADLSGWLGWRSPLRTNALRALDEEVLGDGSAWTHYRGAPLMSLDESLAALPSNVQERVYARAQLVFPVLVFVLAAFWIASGVIGLAERQAAARILEATPLEPYALALAIGGGALDIGIGAALCVRAWVRPAAWAAIGVSIAYLIAASLWAPALWLHPLGPLVKIFPSMALALAAAALDQER